MNHPFRLLAVETSCDETAVAILEQGTRILSNQVSSQVHIHARFGGVVPEIASRKHLEILPILLENALTEAGLGFFDLSAVCATRGPGLIGALLTGFCAAKAISASVGIPFYGVNHLRGHVFANFLDHPDLEPPFIVLLVSGGHTQILKMLPDKSLVLLGKTLDDAAGEAFDKGARLMGLGYPGGPEIEKVAREGCSDGTRFPRPLLDKPTLDFSFSGLKTFLLYHLRKNPGISIPHTAFGFQEAIVEVLVEKSFRAARKNGLDKVVFAGGVAANRRLREVAQQRAEKWGYRTYFPSPVFCTDNAAMIAAAAWHRVLHDQPDSLDLAVDPGLSISA
ncbi:MAG TPA: tRNA (adenosine(37)-N6)-threonylcarbamoyltransferase complex transferase subunit TsaD [Thermotogota bacterium]|nr:tRNA (adenosine(37)-N6)-threonylcarbamoyltransferase complex transferase subunit TsaD [Thermotogota bacterium]HRW91680.1 tRNA (adenosine(37)-N6)-threonylcarbamoyltransferase complex transferase subunit TsaD [Thermotogota bacterium]